MLSARPALPRLAVLLLAAVLTLPGRAQAALLLLPACPSSTLLALPRTLAAAPAPLFVSPASAILPGMLRPAPRTLPLAAPSALLTVWAPPGLNWLWNRGSDPSLRMMGWGQLFNVARLGVYAVPLRTDPAERANILLAARAVDNTTVLPGGTFSFNDVVGERTPARGFAEGLMFDQGQIVRGTGGGICLVSTGLYNAALQAGLAIAERHGHSGVVSYAAPGCDASVVYGSEDMKFVNTTWRPLIVKTSIGANQVLVSLYGTPPPQGQHVSVRTTSLTMTPAPTHQTQDPLLPPGSPPVVDQKPRAGYHVVVERLWTCGGHVTRHETVADERRAPRPKLVRVPVPLAPPVPLAVPPVGLVPAVPGPESTAPAASTFPLPAAR